MHQHGVFQQNKIDKGNRLFNVTLHDLLLRPPVRTFDNMLLELHREVNYHTLLVSETAKLLY